MQRDATGLCHNKTWLRVLFFLKQKRNVKTSLPLVSAQRVIPIVINATHCESFSNCGSAVNGINPPLLNAVWLREFIRVTFSLPNLFARKCVHSTQPVKRFRDLCARHILHYRCFFRKVWLFSFFQLLGILWIKRKKKTNLGKKRPLVGFLLFLFFNFFYFNFYPRNKKEIIESSLSFDRKPRKNPQ